MIFFYNVVLRNKGEIQSGHASLYKDNTTHSHKKSQQFMMASHVHSRYKMANLTNTGKLIIIIIIIIQNSKTRIMKHAR